MTTAYQEMLKAEIEKHVRHLFTKHQKKELVYHNYEHTHTVVRRSTSIAAGTGLGDDDILILFAAAWFHDTGHLFAAPK